MNAQRMEKIAPYFLKLAGIVIAVLIPLYAVKVYQKTDYTDFEVYYRAAVRTQALQWNQIYDLKDGSSPFRYAPLFLPFFRPFAELSLPVAKEVWYFLQVLFFATGFAFLYLTLKQIFRSTSSSVLAGVTSLSFLFILRFCLDTFTIGQVSSLMFLGLCLGLYGWISHRTSLMALGLLIPAAFKIGPGILYGVLLTAPSAERWKVLRTSLLFLLGACLLSFLWMGDGNQFLQLGSDWIKIVLKDSTYFDGAHYGSQCLNSFLLRGVRTGWLNSSGAATLHLSLSIAVCLGLFFFWILRRPQGSLGRGFFFVLGLFPYFWLMPETFKYSLTPLALPVSLLLLERKRLVLFGLALSALPLSLAGKDIVGDFLFFQLQTHSMPFFATLLLGVLVFLSAWTYSKPSPLATQLSSLFRSLTQSIGPWKDLPTKESSLELSFLIPVPLQDSLSLNLPELQKTFREIHELLEELYGNAFEILIIPYGIKSKSFSEDLIPKELSQSQMRVLHDFSGLGRGHAYRIGFLQSRGSRIVLDSLTASTSLDFLKKAFASLDSGPHLVKLTSGKGPLALSRRLALQAFQAQFSGDLLFEKEVSLTAKAGGFLIQKIPALPRLERDESLLRKSFLQKVLDSVQVTLGRIILAWRFRRGDYHPFRLSPAITADDWGLSPGVNAGILALAQKGIVRRVSLLADSPYLQEGLRTLGSLPGIQLGLHFNLTYQKTFSSPGKLLLHWMNPLYPRRQKREWVRAEFKQQMNRLQQEGVQIDYVDGHHHIHLLPGLLREIADLLQEASIKNVRIPFDHALWLTPKIPLLLLSLSNFFLFTRWGVLGKAGIQSMKFFYPGEKHFKNSGCFRSSLRNHDQSEVIVHPAAFNDLLVLGIEDSYTQQRVEEFHALSMLDFVYEEQKNSN